MLLKPQLKCNLQLILISSVTIGIGISSAMETYRFSVLEANEESSPDPDETPVTPKPTVEELPNNAPLKSCGPASVAGVEEDQYLHVFTQYMEPLCEDVRGYCRLKRNTNYTAILRFTPFIPIETLSVRVTLVQPGGFETSFWPEYSACGRFNISCPYDENVPIYAHNEDQVPNEAPPTRGLFRLRLLGTSGEEDKKKILVCRQIYLQLY